jgi:hypothetical protein
LQHLLSKVLQCTATTPLHMGGQTLRGRMTKSSSTTSTIGYVFYHWVRILPLGTYSTIGYAFYHWVRILPLGTHSTIGYVFYHWVRILPLGTHSTIGYAFYHWVRTLPLGTHSTTGYVLYHGVHSLPSGTYSVIGYVLYYRVCTLPSGTYSTIGYVLYHWIRSRTQAGACHNLVLELHWSAIVGCSCRVALQRSLMGIQLLVAVVTSQCCPRRHVSMAFHVGCNYCAVTAIGLLPHLQLSA